MADHIRPVAVPTGLFSVATMVPSTEVDWDVGWALRSSCPAGGTWCCEDGDDADATKNTPAATTGRRNKPFNVYQVVSCLSGTARSTREMEMGHAQAADWLRVNTEGWVSAALETGLCGSPGLDDAIDVTPVGGAVDLASAVSILLRARALQFSFDLPVIHLPNWLGPDWDTTFATALRVAKTAFGPGYGIMPSVQLTDQAWIYITGPVEVTVRDTPNVYTGDDLEEHRRNASYVLHERMAMYRFDPCNAFKIKVVAETGLPVS